MMKPMKMAVKKLAISGLITILLAGCATKPEPHRLGFVAPLPEGYAEVLAASGGIEIAQSLSEIFKDDKLRDLLARATAENFSILLATAQLKAAGFDVNVASASQLPDLTLGGQASRQRNNAVSAASNQFAVSLDSQWEVDIWGSVSASVLLAEKGVEQAEWALAAAKQSVAAQMTQAYLRVIQAKRLAEIADNEWQSYVSIEAAIANQFALGLAGAQDLDNARSARYAAKNRLTADQLEITRAKKSLNQLLAIYPGEPVAVGDAYPQVVAQIDAGVPSELLMRRPDIQQAYLAVKQADTRAEIAYKALFPSFRLTGSLGRSSDTLSGLTSGNLNVWQLAAGIVQPLFDNGRRKAVLGQNSALAEAAYYRYQETILAALTEVEILLSTHNALIAQQQAMKQSLHYAEIAETNARSDYANGLVSIFELLNAQQSKYNAQRSVENLRYASYQNRVSLALALGKAI